MCGTNHNLSKFNYFCQNDIKNQKHFFQHFWNILPLLKKILYDYIKVQNTVPAQVFWYLCKMCLLIWILDCQNLGKGWTEFWKVKHKNCKLLSFFSNQFSYVYVSITFFKKLLLVNVLYYTFTIYTLYRKLLPVNALYYFSLFLVFSKAKSTIKKILPSESTEPVVVFDNGAVAFLSKVKDTHEGPLSEKDNIFFCDLVQIGSDVCVLCLLLREVRDTWKQEARYY